MIGVVSEWLKTRLRLPFAWVLDLLTRWSGRRVGLVLVHHRVGEVAEDGSRHLVPAFGSALFEQGLRHLKSQYRIVPASQLLPAIRARRRGRRLPVAITFDDDLPSHLEVAAPILRRVQVPATFFLTGAYLDGPHAFWWESLQPAFDRGLLGNGELHRIWPASVPAPSEGRIHDVAVAIQELPPAERAAVSTELLQLVGSAPSAGLSADDIRALAAQGFEVGFHTRRHDQLTSLSDEELPRALEDGRAELEELAGAKLTTIAYPHGIADGRVADAARSAGFQWGFTGGQDAVRADVEPLLIGRVEASRRSVGRLAVEVARKLRERPL
jgi:peptidoglycan/xylan/chitin deacetylase (PgdA/CDA1 family)